LHTSLVEKELVKKIFAIDDHIAAAIAGLTADAHVLVNQARIQAQIHRITYSEAITVEALTRRLANLKQMYTQHAGVRPFGVSLLIAGCDEMLGPQLYMTEPSGSYWGYRATAIGSSAPAIIEFLEGEYKEIAQTLKDGSLIALKALKQVSEGEIDPEMIEIVVVSKKTQTIEHLNKKDIDLLIKRLQES
jgi:proteasome alpha subunit